MAIMITINIKESFLMELTAKTSEELAILKKAIGKDLSQGMTKHIGEAAYVSIIIVPEMPKDYSWQISGATDEQSWVAEQIIAHITSEAGRII